MHNRYQSLNFGDAPSLRATTTRCVRRFGIEDFADGAYTTTRKVLPQSYRDRLQLLDAIGIDTAPRVNKWSNQPRPNSTLVIGEISCAQITEVLWLIVRVARRERTQSIWRKQLI